MRTSIILLLAIVLAACSARGPDIPVDDDDTPPAPTAPSEMTVLVMSAGDRGGGDDGMSVAEALGHRATDDLVLVAGALFVDADGGVLLCDAIAESFPPQCGGARIAVDGLDLSTIADLQEENGVRWAESVVLFGSVE